MELVLDEAGHVKLDGGKPVYRHPDGKEIAFDAAATVATINRINAEAKGHRIKFEETEGKLKGFEGLDAEAARAALETVSKLDAKKLIDIGAVDQVKAETAKAYEDKLKAVEEKYAPVIKERDDLRGTLTNERIGGAFARSDFISKKLAIPADMAQSAFGSGFRDEEGTIVGYDRAGNKLFSREKPGEVAGFDEALSIMVDAYPHRDSILKGGGGSGGGAPGSGINVVGKSLTRASFTALPPAEQMKHVKAGGAVTD